VNTTQTVPAIAPATIEDEGSAVALTLSWPSEPGNTRCRGRSRPGPRVAHHRTDRRYRCPSGRAGPGHTHVARRPGRRPHSGCLPSAVHRHRRARHARNLAPARQGVGRPAESHRCSAIAAPNSAHHPADAPISGGSVMPLTDRVPYREVSTRDPLTGNFSTRAKRVRATPARPSHPASLEAITPTPASVSAPAN
jgi:hypothetical protein